MRDGRLRVAVASRRRSAWPCWRRWPAGCPCSTRPARRWTSWPAEPWRARRTPPTGDRGRAAARRCAPNWPTLRTRRRPAAVPAVVGQHDISRSLRGRCTAGSTPDGLQPRDQSKEHDDEVTAEILRRLVRRFGLLVLLTVLGGIAGGVVRRDSRPRPTRAKAYVVVTADAGRAVSPPSTSPRRTAGSPPTGPVLTPRPRPLGPAARGLRQVTASTSPDAPVIEITATGTDAEPHRRRWPTRSRKASIDFAGNRKAETRVGAVDAGAGGHADQPSSPKPPLELAVGAAAGLLLGGLAALAGVGRSAGDAGPTGPAARTHAADQPPRDRDGRRVGRDRRTMPARADPARPLPAITGAAGRRRRDGHRAGRRVPPANRTASDVDAPSRRRSPRRSSAAPSSIFQEQRRHARPRGLRRPRPRRSHAWSVEVRRDDDALDRPRAPSGRPVPPLRRGHPVPGARLAGVLVARLRAARPAAAGPRAPRRPAGRRRRVRCSCAGAGLRGAGPGRRRVLRLHRRPRRRRLRRRGGRRAGRRAARAAAAGRRSTSRRRARAASPGTRCATRGRRPATTWPPRSAWSCRRTEFEHLVAGPAGARPQDGAPPGQPDRASSASTSARSSRRTRRAPSPTCCALHGRSGRAAASTPSTCGRSSPRTSPAAVPRDDRRRPGGAAGVPARRRAGGLEPGDRRHRPRRRLPLRRRPGAARQARHHHAAAARHAAAGVPAGLRDDEHAARRRAVQDALAPGRVASTGGCCWSGRGSPRGTAYAAAVRARGAGGRAGQGARAVAARPSATALRAPSAASDTRRGTP